MLRITVKHDFVLPFLSDLLSHQPNSKTTNTPTTTLIICSTRADFLSQLHHSIQTWHPPRTEIPASQEDSDEEITDTKILSPDNNPQQPQRHAFLTPTLHLLSTSSTVKLVFCPTIPHLRGYTSTYTSPTTTPASKTIIINALSLHNSTSEFTFQGLSRSFSSIASMCHRVKYTCLVVELRDTRDGDGDEDDEMKGSKLWDVAVPLLSGSVKVGEGAKGWARGRDVVVRKVVERWFDFEG